MGFKRSTLRSVLIAGVLLPFSLILTGCMEVGVVDTTPESNTPVVSSSLQPSGVSERDLAILAVEFDPPLDYRYLSASTEPVALLVAVENKGSSTERQVAVIAELTSPEDPDLFVSQRTIVERIAPGEVQVVRFPRLDSIPYHWLYHLEVAVEPLEGEGYLSDNRKAFDIQIHRR